MTIETIEIPGTIETPETETIEIPGTIETPETETETGTIETPETPETEIEIETETIETLGTLETGQTVKIMMAIVALVLTAEETMQMLIKVRPRVVSLACAA